MRNLNTVIDQITALLPPNPTPEVAAEVAVLQAELIILRRVAAYAAPESSTNSEAWQRLSTACYRYLPNPKGYPWAQQISDVITAIG